MYVHNDLDLVGVLQVQTEMLAEQCVCVCVNAFIKMHTHNIHINASTDHLLSANVCDQEPPLQSLVFIQPLLLLAHSFMHPILAIPIPSPVAT